MTWGSRDGLAQAQGPLAALLEEVISVTHNRIVSNLIPGGKDSGLLILPESELRDRM